jgi:hypothetical protein
MVAKYTSFCFTVRPRHGLDPEQDEDLLKFCRSFEGAQMVIEKSGAERHAHIQVWSSNPVTRGDANKKLERVCVRCIPNWDSEQNKVLRTGTKIAYSDWIESYCAQNESKTGDDKPQIVFDERPVDTDRFYPSQEEQEAIQAEAHAVDKRFHRLEQQFLEWIGDDEVTLRRVGEFISDSMFSSRTIPVIVKMTDRSNLTKALYMYVTKSTMWQDSVRIVDTKHQERQIAQIVANGASDVEAENIILG